MVGKENRRLQFRARHNRQLSTLKPKASAQPVLHIRSQRTKIQLVQEPSTASGDMRNISLHIRRPNKVLFLDVECLLVEFYDVLEVYMISVIFIYGALRDLRG
jgi:hypothetical protein